MQDGRYSHTYEGLVEFWIQTASCNIKYRFDHYTTLASDVTTTANILNKEVFPYRAIPDQTLTSKTCLLKSLKKYIL